MDGPQKVLVSARSATDGRWEEEGEPGCIPLEKDHSHLVKFTAHDGHYPTVLQELLAIVNAALEGTT